MTKRFNLKFKVTRKKNPKATGMETKTVFAPTRKEAEQSIRRSFDRRDLRVSFVKKKKR